MRMYTLKHIILVPALALIVVDYVVGDVGNEQDVVRTVTSVIEKHGRLDILVNNAGYGEAIR